MVVERGEIWWSDLPEPVGSGPGLTRPVLIIQSEFFNESSISTVSVAIITTNLDLAEMPGNILLSKQASKLPKDSVVNVTQIYTIDKGLLREYVSSLPSRKINQIDDSLRFALSL
jgi:mRNA interferase MazF